MSSPAPITPAIVNAFLDLLVPLFLTFVGGNTETARAIAAELLADFNPQTPRELDLAAKAIGNGFRSLILLSKSADTGLSLADLEQTLKLACSLARAGHQAQRQLELLRQERARALHRRRLAAVAEAPPEPAHDPAPPAAAAEDATTHQGATPDPVDAANVETLVTGAAAPAEPQDAAAGLAKAEKTLASAERLLSLMQQHVKGGVPPHSKAAQDIAAQHRVVHAARLALVQARRAAEPCPIRLPAA